MVKYSKFHMCKLKSLVNYWYVGDKLPTTKQCLSVLLPPDNQKSINSHLQINSEFFKSLKIICPSEKPWMLGY